MKKEIITLDKEKRTIQITTYDERWYTKEIKDEKTGLPKFEFYPSVTWITGYYPKGIGFMKWLAQKGWDEAELAKEEAGAKGYKVHLGASALLKGLEVSMKDAFPPEYGKEPEPLKPDEYECLMTLANWIESSQVDPIVTEYVAFNEKEKYAGTIDLICRIGEQIYIIDFKISSQVWPEYELQLSAYSHLEIELEKLGIKPEEWEKRKLAILQVGYNRNKNGWKFTEVKDQLDLFLAIKKTWQKECEGIKLQQKDYPLSLKIERLAKKLCQTKQTKTKSGKK